jgi:tRNA(Arg) A34 adenosine deaminase TadA
MNDEDYMRLAMAEAEKAAGDGNAPFGVVVVDNTGTVVATDHDRVRELTDPTAHGEINAIRNLCKKLGTLDLGDYIFYTTAEPCPTCLSACIKARVRKLFYGAVTEPTASLPIKAEFLAKFSKNPIELIGGILAAECLEQRKNLQRS